jgi:glycine betaine/choline ABC-type transport system substrate-binding protein
MRSRKLVCFTLVAVMLLSVFSITGCSQKKATTSAKKGTIVVAGKNFGEGYILGWLAATLIDKKTDLKVDTSKIGMGATELLYPALKKGDIDVYCDYDGTLRAIIEKNTAVEHDRQKIYNDIKGFIKTKDNVDSIGPLGFNDTFAISMTKEKASQLGITKLSDLKGHPELKLIGDSTTWTRPDAYTAMAAFYGISLQKGPMVDTNFFYDALKQGQGDIITAFSTDGRLKKYGYTVLKDDKGFYPWYDAMYLVNGNSFKKYPEIQTALKPLVNKLTEEDMITMNEKVDVEKQDPKKVAVDFLKSKGLI